MAVEWSQHVLRIAYGGKIVKWMKEKNAIDGEKNLRSKSVKRFPNFFT